MRIASLSTRLVEKSLSLDDTPTPYGAVNNRTYTGRVTEATHVKSRISAKQVRIGLNVWTVYEDPRTGPPSYGPSLVFDADRISRRVRQYPRNWRELTDEELGLVLDAP